MADFPALVPSIRPLTPGRWGGASLSAMNGQVSGLRRSSAEIGRRVSLRFENVSETQFLDIVDHYRGQRSGLDGFSFTATTLPASYTPSGHNWLYAGPPQVVDRHQDVFAVEMECRSEPRAIFRVPGVAFTQQPTLTAGAIVPFVPGLAISQAPTLAAGSVTAILSGLAISQTPALAAGAMTEIVPGAALGPGPIADSTLSCLLHFDGSDNSTTITDSSANNFTFTVSGNAKISTTDPKFGTGALTLDGNGDFVTGPTNSAFQFGTGNFAVDCWVYVNSGNTNDGLFTFGGSSSGLALAVYLGNWTLTTSGSGGTTMGAVTTGAWQHIAVTRSGSSLRMFVNGTQLGSTLTNSTNLTDNQLQIGYYFSSSFAINARIDEFRVKKGDAVWTANFTAPTGPYADSTSTASFAPGAPV